MTQPDEPVPAAGEGGRGWETFPHTADVGVRGRGASLDEALAQAAVALTSVIADPAAVRPEVPVEVRCEAPAPDLLLYEWLNALVYEMATRRMLFARFDVHVAGSRLHATAWGEPIDRARHHPSVEVKGATLTELAVVRSGDGSWTAQCVLDV